MCFRERRKTLIWPKSVFLLLKVCQWKVFNKYLIMPGCRCLVWEQLHRHRHVELYELAQMKQTCIPCKSEKFKEVLRGEFRMDCPCRFRKLSHGNAPATLQTLLSNSFLPLSFTNSHMPRKFFKECSSYAPVIRNALENSAFRKSGICLFFEK